MRKQELLRAVGTLDDRYLDEALVMNEKAEKERKAWRLPRFGKWASAAACLLLACALVAVPFIRNAQNNVGIEQGDVDVNLPLVWDAGAGTFWYSTTPELGSLGFSFAAILDGEYESFRFGGIVLTQDKIGQKLGETVARKPINDIVREPVYDIVQESSLEEGTAIDQTAQSMWECAAMLYEVIGMDSRYAIAVSFEGDDDYYLFFNREADAATFGAYMNGFGLSALMRVGTTVTRPEFECGISAYTRYTMTQTQTETLAAMILACGDAERREMELGLPFLRLAQENESFGFTVICDVFGMDGGIQIFADGTLAIDLASDTVLFYDIGAARAREIIDYVKQNAVHSEREVNEPVRGGHVGELVEGTTGAFIPPEFPRA